MAFWKSMCDKLRSAHLGTTFSYFSLHRFLELATFFADGESSALWQLNLKAYWKLFWMVIDFPIILLLICAEKKTFLYIKFGRFYLRSSRWTLLLFLIKILNQLSYAYSALLCGTWRHFRRFFQGSSHRVSYGFYHHFDAMWQNCRSSNSYPHLMYLALGPTSLLDLFMNRQKGRQAERKIDALTKPGQFEDRLEDCSYVITVVALVG